MCCRAFATSENVDKLTDYSYLTKSILLPAVSFARAREWITETEEHILTSVIKMKVVTSSDIAKALPTLTANQRTYQIKNLVEQGMLLPVSPGSRQYTIGFSNNYLVRGVIKALGGAGGHSRTTRQAVMGRYPFNWKSTRVVPRKSRT